MVTSTVNKVMAVGGGHLNLMLYNGKIDNNNIWDIKVMVSVKHIIPLLNITCYLEEGFTRTSILYEKIDTSNGHRKLPNNV